MKPTRRLRELWNWLPVFRAVAETEHLPTAAKALFISPASLSRTIGLLEENIGSPLFDRVGRNLRLNSSGAILLDAVRDGMRAIDEGVSSVNGSLWNGQLCLWAGRNFATYFLLPVIGELQKQHPSLHPLLRTTDVNSVPDRILRGQIDLALLETPPSHKQLKVDKLLELPYALYCAPTNALATRDTLSVQELSNEHSFAITRSESGENLDSYPAESARKSILAVEDMTMAIQACFELSMVTCLPCIVGEAANLHQLPLDVLPARALYAVYRKPIGTHPRTELLLEILRNQIEAKAPD
ncbi:MAG: LysR family transcriptional regulator [Kofleriaceae bacterium]|nr:LysR family transcriptional regulator [Kofleriaceae bacterium]